jgi:hypothetical protein
MVKSNIVLYHQTNGPWFFLHRLKYELGSTETALTQKQNQMSCELRHLLGMDSDAAI